MAPSTRQQSRGNTELPENQPRSGDETETTGTEQTEPQTQGNITNPPEVTAETTQLI